ncbi:hypothetical protein L218DRAFT_931140 [Marasmius fiardii PR-910]|nr:hypothetical protein L218DRAFT_931140 [Marasmius fiardii PR-910]
MTPLKPSERRIYLVGPSSTGKTTLCKAIASHLSLPASIHLSEVARDVIRAGGWTRKDIGLLEMQQRILDAHAEKERQIIEKTAEDGEKRGGGIQLLSDRSAIDPIVYAILTSNSAEAETDSDALLHSPSFQAVLPMYLSPLSEFYLLEPVEEWLKDDGFRHVGDQVESFEIFERLFRDLGIPYQVIPKEMADLDERIRFVLNETF